VGAGNNFLLCTDAEGGLGVERSDTAVRPGKALLGAGRPRIGGVDQMQTSLGAGATARSAGALRRHLADKIPIPQLNRLAGGIY